MTDFGNVTLCKYPGKRVDSKTQYNVYSMQWYFTLHSSKIKVALTGLGLSDYKVLIN